MENIVPPFGKIEPTFSDNDDDEARPATIEETQEAAEARMEVAPLKNRINKKRAAMLLLFVAIIVTAVAFLTLQSKPTSHPQTPTRQPITFIDDNEHQNKFLKENPAAKDANVNVFEFDINKCLQQYSDAQCTDMYEKNLLITEKK